MGTMMSDPRPVEVSTGTSASTVVAVVTVSGDPDFFDSLATLRRGAWLTGAVVIAFLAVLAWILARNVSRPVQSIGATVRRLSDGDFAARADRRFAGEIGDLAERVNQLAATLKKNRTARQR